MSYNILISYTIIYWLVCCLVYLVIYVFPWGGLRAHEVVALRQAADHALGGALEVLGVILYYV